MAAVGSAEDFGLSHADLVVLYAAKPQQALVPTAHAYVS
jgi:hypothetical protein